MSWAPVNDVDWSAVANTASVAAGATLSNGWIESSGSTWAVSGGKLVGSTSSNSGYGTKHILRPVAEAVINQRVVVKFAAGDLGAEGCKGIVLRYQTGNTFYLLQVTSNALLLFTISGGAPTQLVSVNWTGTYDAGHTYTAEFSATGVNSTALSGIVTDTTTTAVVATVSLTNSLAALQTSGCQGLVVWSSTGAASTFPITQSTTYTEATALTSGVFSFSGRTPTAVTLACTAASGGSSPYTYNIYRSATAGFTPGVGNLLASNVSFPYTDSSPLSGFAYYKVVATDSASATVVSNQIGTSGPWLSPIKLGFIGDSIWVTGTGGSNGVGSVPDYIAACLQNAYGERNVTIYNSAQNGMSTADWLPIGGSYPAAKSNFTSNGITHVNIMIGTNDARNDNMRTASAYLANLSSIVNDLVSSGFVVILHYQPYAVPGSLSGGWTEASCVLLDQYKSQIDSLVNGTTVLAGDKLAYQYTAEHPSWSSDGIHPNLTGILALGRMQANAIYKALFPAASAGTVSYLF